jgi:hypothetical protein
LRKVVDIFQLLEEAGYAVTRGSESGNDLFGDCGKPVKMTEKNKGVCTDD